MKKTATTEELLLLQLSKGDQDAFTSLYNQYSSAVNEFVLRYVKSTALTDDITQEVFVKIWEGREQLSEIQSFRAWLFTVARNHTLNLLKKISRESEVMGEVLKNYQDPPSDVENKLVEKEYMDWVADILNTLSPQSREVFRLCREHDKSYDEVADILGISRNAVKKHIVRMHKTFRINMKDHLNFPAIFLFNLFF